MSPRVNRWRVDLVRFRLKAIKINKGNVNECRTALVKNIIKESFYGKKKKSN